MSFSGMTILFTGKLASMKREDAEAKVVSLGGKIASSVTKKLSILVATSNTSAKWKKAEELNGKGANIQLWTEEQFMAELDKVEGKSDADAGTEGKSDADAKAKKKATKNSKFESIRPFIIEIETFSNNCVVRYEINKHNDVADIEYEVLCSDSEKVQILKGDFSHKFKYAGKYKISFRGNLPGVLLGDHADFVERKGYVLLDVCQWGDIAWLNMDKMFLGCRRFDISADDQPNLSRVTSLSEMFKESSMNAPLEKWDVSKVTDMSGMFMDAREFNQPLEKWDVSKVTNMSNMFKNAVSFNQPLEKWDVSKVTNMSGMFSLDLFMYKSGDSISRYINRTFNQPLEKWNVSKVTNMNKMFSRAISFNQPLEKWNVSKVTDMAFMFSHAISFNQPLEIWNVSKVTDMRYMFSQASSFNQPLEKWNVSKVTDMEGMFKDAKSMNKLPSWLKES